MGLPSASASPASPPRAEDPSPQPSGSLRMGSGGSGALEATFGAESAAAPLSDSFLTAAAQLGGWGAQLGEARAQPGGAAGGMCGAGSMRLCDSGVWALHGISIMGSPQGTAWSAR